MLNKNIKAVTSLIISTILLSSTGCSTTQETSQSKKDLSVIEKENNELKSEMEALKTSIESTIEEVETTTEPSEEKTEIKIGDVISNENKEITIKNIEFSYDVLPDKIDGFYNHYPADDGKVYIHIDTDVKNLQKQNLDCDKIMSVTADYNNGFTYKSQTSPEDDSTGFTYANITSIDPLETLGVRFLIDCPEEVKTSENPLFLNLTVDKKEYKYTIK